MKKDLFSEFPKVSTKQWKQQIQYDLKGQDYNDALVWQSPEGINVKPFYNADDLPKDETNLGIENWTIKQTIFVADVDKSNANALQSIDRGAEAINFILETQDVDYQSLLRGIDVEGVKLQFSLLFLSNEFVENLKHFIVKNFNLETFQANCVVNTDIIGNLARSGNWFKNLKADHHKFEAIVKHTSCIGISGDLYENAGANMAQQLAYSLAQLNEYLNHLDASSKTINPINIFWTISVGSNYFFEIAKLRAFRILFNSLYNLYDLDLQLTVSAMPSKRNKTIYDYNVNMLRTTTECMSAILGGADLVENLPYDALYNKNNEFGDRIARNQLLILKNESNFENVSNAANGTFYIESITNQLAEKALVIFKDIEAAGGFLRMLKDGKIQQKIKENADLEAQRLKDDDLKLVGTTYHTNHSDKMKGQLELYPFLKRNPRKTLIEPIIEKRLAESVEKARLATEES